MPAAEALACLKAGNRRFAAGTIGHGAPAMRPAEAAGEQRPHAIILGCSDSRVPAEIVFDQGLGDLFVIRVAGNIVASSQIGSVEFAATKFGTRLVVVLGHTECGAVLAAVEQLQAPYESRSRNLRSIVDFVRPSVEECLQVGAGDDQATLVRKAVRANINASVRALQHGSEILEELIDKEGLMIVGAEYCLQSGCVEFFTDPVDRSAGEAR
jgi:carbonic anhydrase